MDVMDVRVENAFQRLVENGALLKVEPGSSDGSRLYRSRSFFDETSLSRVERILLYQARWLDSREAILQRSSARLRCSNAVRWAYEHGKVNTIQELFG